MMNILQTVLRRRSTPIQRFLLLGFMLLAPGSALAGLTPSQNDPLSGLIGSPKNDAAEAVTENVNREAMSGPGRTLGTFMQAMTDLPKNYEIAVDCLDLGSGITINDANRQRALDLYTALSALG